MSYTITQAIRKEKRDAAAKRLDNYNKLTLEQKLAAATGAKQRRKLFAAIKLRDKRAATKAK